MGAEESVFGGLVNSQDFVVDIVWYLLAFVCICRLVNDLNRLINGINLLWIIFYGYLVRPSAYLFAIVMHFRL